jgi:hypothetical protein
VNSLNQSCASSQQCAGTLQCTNGLCKSPNGGACSRASDCATASICENGQCGTRAGTGCTTSAQCGSGLECDGGLCYYSVGTSCAADTNGCAAGLNCNSASSLSPVCQQPLGGPCPGGQGDCPAGTICDSTTTTCLSLPGGTCTADSSCTQSIPATPLSCVQGTCGDLSCTTNTECESMFGSAAVCAGDTGSGQCYLNGVCISPVASTCIQYAANAGTTCVAGTLGNYCQGVTGTPCASGVECVSGTCDQSSLPGTCM